MAKRPTVSAITVAALVSVGACERTTPPKIEDDWGQCRQSTGEFGNTGCADVLGSVVGARQQPLAGVEVGPRQSLSGGLFNTPYVVTDALGRFRLRLTRMAPPGWPDTASVWVGATIRPVLPQLVATIRDSVLVVVTVAPVGQVPEPAHVSITLPVQ